MPGAMYVFKDRILSHEDSKTNNLYSFTSVNKACKFEFIFEKFQTCFRILSMFGGSVLLLILAASFSISMTLSIFPVVNNQRGDSGSILKSQERIYFEN